MTKSRSSLRTQQKAFTRARLLEAAREIFMERGYVDVTVEDIADSAGASRATFYSYFRSKTDVVMALLEEVERKAIERYAELDAIIAGPPEQRDARLRDSLKVALKNWRKWKNYNLAMWQAATLEPAIEQQILKDAEIYSGTLTATLKKADPKDRKRLRERAMMLDIMCARLFYMAAHYELPVNDEALLDFLAELWISQLTPSEQR